jgi:hypothetical protein
MGVSLALVAAAGQGAAWPGWIASLRCAGAAVNAGARPLFQEIDLPFSNSTFVLGMRLSMRVQPPPLDGHPIGRSTVDLARPACRVELEDCLNRTGFRASIDKWVHNRTDLGELKPREQWAQAERSEIVSQDVWNEVRAILATHGRVRAHPG